LTVHLHLNLEVIHLAFNLNAFFVFNDKNAPPWD